MSATTKISAVSQPQFLVDADGNKTAVMLSLEVWERVESFLQSDLERALLSEPISEDVSPSIAKRLRAHAKGKKGQMLTLEAFQSEVDRLKAS